MIRGRRAWRRWARASAFGAGLAALATGVASPAGADEPKRYRIDWQKGTLTEIVCENGAFYTIRYSESRKLYFVQERVDFYDKTFEKVAARACGE